MKPSLSISPSRRLKDRAARWIVSAGGLAIIASILGIFLFILAEVLPLLSGGTLKEEPAAADAAPPAVAAMLDEHQSTLVVLGRDGVVRSRTASDSFRELAFEGYRSEAVERAALLPHGRGFLAATRSGALCALLLRFDVEYRGDMRVTKAVAAGAQAIELGAAGSAPGLFSGAVAPEGGGLFVAIAGGARLLAARSTTKENPITGEVTASWSQVSLRLPEGVPAGAIRAMCVDGSARHAFAAAATGEILWWEITDAEGERTAKVTVTEGAAPTALAMLIGDRSLVLGRQDGALETYSMLRDEKAGWLLRRIHTFAPLKSAVSALSTSLRNKGFLAGDQLGNVALYYSTSERLLDDAQLGVGPIVSLELAPKSDGAVVVGESGVARLSIKNPHPEVTWSSLFAPVWYEGDPEPTTKWQSTSGTDDFEPKLGLMPLLIGTLKGTFYSLLLAIPLAIFSAVYASQFMAPALRQIVKPMIEIMAALPSVVLGFLAGLWLAPRVERSLVGMLIMVVLLPASVLLAGAASTMISPSLRSRFPAGVAAACFMPVLLVAGALALALGGPVEDSLFGGNAGQWITDHLGVNFEQKNAIVVGLAMGVAVIPIIFSIAEDALSNVPRSLSSGSLALGASRWQTVVRVVIPTASPGIFSAVMVGFGRAVGETMIVVMATGNTPVMSWSPFNGFRTLSANIATEIPEAAQGSTHYRVLFLSVLLLFVVTFAANTVAEVIRQRLRKRYASL